MSNHLHLIASAKNKDLSSIIRDYKKFTSSKIISAIQQNPRESRKEWMIPIFKNKAESNSRNKMYQFWKQDNHPEELYSPEFTYQKIDYIHQNPVHAGIVDNPCDYIYSSARNYEKGGREGLLNITFL